MSQNLLEEKRASEINDFSTLAWKFNNLNSTAKMLLVGASPSSVPFIPISDLVEADNVESSPYKSSAIPDTNLSISSLSSSKESLSKGISKRLISPPPAFQHSYTYKDTKLSNNSSSTIEKSNDSSALLSASSKEEENVPFNTSSYAETEKPIEKKVLGDPVPAKEKLEVNRNIPLVPIEGNTSNIEQTDLTKEKTTEEAPSDSETLNQNLDPSIPPFVEDLKPSGTPSWSYKGAPAEEEEYYSLKEELTRKNNKAGVGPFLKGTARSAAIVSLIAILGFGAYNLLKKEPNQDIENYINEKDELDEDLTTDPFSDRIDQSEAFELSDKSIFSESNSDSSETLIEEEKNSYYQPTVRSKKKVIQPAKPKVFSSSKTYKSSPVQSNKSPYSSTSRSNISKQQTSSPTTFLYDPSTVYDSSSSEAISPSTYSARKFPLEISYAKSNSLYEAPLDPSTGTVISSYASTQPLGQEDKVSSGYPIVQQPQYNQVSDQGSPVNNFNIDNSQVNSLQDIPSSNINNQISIPVVSSPTVSGNQQSTYSSGSLTSEEQNISDSFSNENIDSANSEVNLLYPQNNTQNSLPVTNKSLEDDSVNYVQQIPSTGEGNIAQESQFSPSEENVDLSIPLLREPVQSSSNLKKEFDLSQPLPSPYSKQAPLTTSTFINQDSEVTENINNNKPNEVVKSSNYQPRRGRVSRFLDRFKSKKRPSKTSSTSNTYSNELNNIERKAKSQNLSDYEKRQLLSQIDSLKNKIISNRNSSQPSSADLNRLEREANSVYVEPSPYESNPNGGVEDTTLNIS
ncbi:MAG: hypothetical protein QNJ31_01970 [Candidatus Caenarcaniphilales bacterium]|nr:hypothetical protein [Candidatus Caenarcaniphilales bacterium]